VGDTLRLSAEAFDENGHRVDGAMFEWSSSDAEVAQVDGTGLVAGVAEGTARISAVTGDAAGLAQITVANPDRAALVSFYEATDGPNWVNSENWLTDAPLSEWFGVSVNDAGAVTALETYANNLRRSIPAHVLERFAHLERLQLGDNMLTGRIPAALGTLTNLSSLALYGNALTGHIPSNLGQLHRLESLNLSANSLTGPIPPELGNTDLRSLSLSHNALTGSVPTQLSELSNLSWLDISNNQLTGQVPAAVTILDQLSYFNWSGNSRLCVPRTEAFNDWLSAVESHRGRRCALSSVRAALVALYEATDGDNWLRNDHWLTDEPVGEWYGVGNGGGGTVGAVVLPANGLRGRVPAELGDLANLRSLVLDRNDLAGEVPASLALELTHLEEFTWSGNPGLCVPRTRAFESRLDQLAKWLGQLCGEERPGFQIELIFHDFPAGYERAFTAAASYWMTTLAGTELPDFGGAIDLCGYNSVPRVVDDLAIVVTIDEDGPGVASAAQCRERGGDGQGFPYSGVMFFKTALLGPLDEAGSLESLVRHEIAHVLGIGSWWAHSRWSELLENPTVGAPRDTHFRGPLAISAFDGAGGSSYSSGKVPVENRLPGSNNAHWRESVFGPAELMAPAMVVGSRPATSAITLQALADMGYVVDLSQVEPYTLPAADGATDKRAPLIDLRGDVRRLPPGNSQPRPSGERQSGATPS